MARTRRPKRFSLFSWQLMIRSLVIAGFSALLTAYDWVDLGVFAAATGIALAAAGLLGIVGDVRHWEKRGRKLRLVDGIMDVGFGVMLVVEAIQAPTVTPMTFALWAIIAGLLSIVHTLPTRMQDLGPHWGWLWSGICLGLTGIATLIFQSYMGPATGLWAAGLGLSAATMAALLGMDMTYPAILAQPWQNAPCETMFTYDDIHFKPTEQVLPKKEEPPKTGAA